VKKIKHSIFTIKTKTDVKIIERSDSWHRRVVELIKADWTIEEIAKHLDVCNKSVRNSIEKYGHLIIDNSSKIYFEHKNEPYCTEEEMLTGYIIPDYFELSKSEKQIYDEKEKRSN